MHKAISWFNEITKSDIATVGGKGANLGEMTKAGIPVPPGFVITSDTYFDFIKEASIIDKIRCLLEPLDVNDSKRLQQVAAQVMQLILDAHMPKHIAEEIEKAEEEIDKILFEICVILNKFKTLSNEVLDNIKSVQDLVNIDSEGEISKRIIKKYKKMLREKGR